MSRLRVAYLLQGYPQISRTYVNEEIASLEKDYEIKIWTWSKPFMERKNHHPYEFIPNIEDILPKVKAFKPHVMHTHYLSEVEILDKFARQLFIPYTVRTHSINFSKVTKEKLSFLCHLMESPLCLRALCYPDFKQRFIELGAPAEKLVPCWPVVNYPLFYHPEKKSPQRRILNVGTTLPKKNYKSFIDLAFLMKDSGNEFNLYVMGKEREMLENYNAEKGHPVKKITCVEYEEMPKVYQSHDWLVYTGDPEMNALGLPMAISEAQASGIGVCLQEMPGRKEALLDYMGGAGYLFKSIDELPAILQQPYPEEMRLKGLENAKKCDINVHKKLLTQIWDRLK